VYISLLWAGPIRCASELFLACERYIRWWSMSSSSARWSLQIIFQFFKFTNILLFLLNYFQNFGFFWFKFLVKFSLWVFHKSIFKRKWVLLIKNWMFWYYCKFDFRRFCFHSTNQVWRRKRSCADWLSLLF